MITTPFVIAKLPQAGEAIPEIATDYALAMTPQHVIAPCIRWVKGICKMPKRKPGACRAIFSCVCEIASGYALAMTRKQAPPPR